MRLYSELIEGENLVASVILNNGQEILVSNLVADGDHLIIAQGVDRNGCEVEAVLANQALQVLMTKVKAPKQNPMGFLYLRR